MAALTPDNNTLVSLHGRVLGFLGDALRFNGHYFLWAGTGSKAKVIASTRLPVTTTAAGAAAAGAVTISGVNGGAPNVGDLVETVINLTTPADASASFETTISVAGQIQQSSASNLSGSTFLFRILPQS